MAEKHRNRVTEAFGEVGECSRAIHAQWPASLHSILLVDKLHSHHRESGTLNTADAVEETRRVCCVKRNACGSRTFPSPCLTRRMCDPKILEGKWKWCRAKKKKTKISVHVLPLAISHGKTTMKFPRSCLPGTAWKGAQTVRPVGLL